MNPVRFSSSNLELQPNGTYKLKKAVAPEKKSKYGNRKVTIDGLKFDSEKEGRRYQDLKLPLTAGQLALSLVTPSRLIFLKKENPAIVK